MRSKLTLLILFLIKFFFANAQQDSLINEDRFFITEEIFHFQGQGIDGVRKYIDENLIYPKYAYDKHIIGKVLIQFTIDSRGQVRDVYVLRGIDLSIDYAAYKVIENMPGWTLGKASGRVNPITFICPVVFDTKKIKPQQISNVYDKQIEYLLTLDSLSVDSILYRKKITITEYKKIQHDGSTKSQIINNTNDTLINKTLSIKRGSEKPELSSSNKVVTDNSHMKADSATYNLVLTDHEKGHNIAGKIELEGYSKCVCTDTDYNLIDIILNGTYYTHPGKDGCFSFNNILDTINSPVINISFNKKTEITQLANNCYFEDFSMYFPITRNDMDIPEVFLLNIRPLTTLDLLWNSSLKNRFRDKKSEKIKRVIYYVPKVFKKVIIFRMIRNRHFSYRLEDTKGVYKSIKIDSDEYGYKYILDGKYRTYYNTGELKSKGKTKMGKCIGIWKIYNKKREIIATYDFTGATTIYNWIKVK